MQDDNRQASFVFEQECKVSAGDDDLSNSVNDAINTKSNQTLLTPWLPGRLLKKEDYYFLTDELAHELMAFETETGDVVVYVDKNRYLDVSLLSIIAQLERTKNVSVHMQSIETMADVYQQSLATVSYQYSKQIQFAHALFKEAVQLGASDIHIISEVQYQTMIFFRIHGQLIKQVHRAMSYNSGIQLVRAIYNVMCEEGATQFRLSEKLDGRIAMREHLPKQLESIRISSIGLHQLGHSFVLRLLYNDVTAFADFEKLGYEPSQITRLNTIAKQPHGCCFIAGPTGSGKSTTLKVLLEVLMSSFNYQKNVMTIEDPVEYPIYGARQSAVVNVQTNNERDDAFAQAIVACMRHDPDVIMVGEVRDAATAKQAIIAAQTGHFVPASIHANNAISIANRLQGIGVKDDDIFNEQLIVALIAQRLVPSLCPNCRVLLSQVQERFDEKAIQALKKVLGTLKNVYVKGAGCSQCRDGIAGQTVIAEIIEPDEQLMRYLKMGQRHDAMHYFKSVCGGLTMMDHATLKIKRGQLDPFMVMEETGNWFLTTKTQRSKQTKSSVVISDVEKIAKPNQEVIDVV